MNKWDIFLLERVRAKQRLATKGIQAIFVIKVANPTIKDTRMANLRSLGVGLIGSCRYSNLIQAKLLMPIFSPSGVNFFIFQDETMVKHKRIDISI